MRASVARYLPEGGTLPADVWARRHLVILMLLWAHAAAVPAYAAVRGYELSHVLQEAAIVPAAALIAGFPRLSRRVRTLAASFGLMSSSAVLVHLSGGLIEMHFHFFVMVAVVSLYQDWLPFLGAIGYVLIHHGLMGTLDPESVYNHPAAIAHPWRWAGVHALFILAISAASVVNWRLTETHTVQRLRAEERLAEEGKLVAKVNEVGRLLSSDLEPEHVVQQVTDLATELTAAQFGAFFYNVVNDHGDAYMLYTLSGIPMEAFADFPMPRATDLFGPTFRGEGAIRIADVTTDPRYGQLGPHHGMPPGHLPVRSYLAVPVVAGDEVLGGLFFGHPEVGRFTEADERLVIGVSAHAAVALRNAQRYVGQRAAATTLQHSLLPSALPAMPGVQAAARYHAGRDGTEVGGDWYDLVSLPNGNLGLSIGDVLGQGIKAAAVMGQLRNGLRAYAMDCLPPGTTLERLNHLLQETGTTGYVGTVLYGVYELETGRLLVANAGHLPLLVKSPAGAVDLVAEGLGIPLGVDPEARYREAVFQVEPGSMLCLYTDGLVEDRQLPLDEGLARLRSVAAAAPDDPGLFCDHLVEALTTDRVVVDDTAVLAMWIEPLSASVRYDVPWDVRGLLPLRGAIRRWLREIGVGDDDTHDIVLALGEASSNVIRHADASADTFEVACWAGADHVSIMVRNEGGWRLPDPHRIGGRGLKILRQLMDEVDLIEGPPETVVTMRRVLSPAATPQAATAVDTTC